MGEVISTNNNYDLAIASRGFLVVQMIDGTELYTRNGQLGLNFEGELVTQAGQNDITRVEIPRGAKNVSFAEDGTISAQFEDSCRTIGYWIFTGCRLYESSGYAVCRRKLICTPESGIPIEMTPQDGLRIKQGLLRIQ